MEMLCPECMGPLATEDGETARCTLHGGEFRILYRRQVSVGEATATAIAGGAGAEVTPVGGLESEGRVKFGTTEAAVEGVMCVNHPGVQAERHCKACHKPICGTCDFALPGNVHVCPACATQTKPGMSSARKTLVGWGIGLAIWSTVALAGLFAVAAGMPAEPGAEEALGIAFSLLIFVPSLIGTALSFAARDRRLSNPPLVWVAIVWNSVILAVLILLILIGLTVQA
jgi:hypothetical protein